MSKILGGITWMYNGESQDYCWREAIACLCELCDHVVALDAGSTDDSGYELLKLQAKYPNLNVVLSHHEIWEAEKGKEKLSVMQNMALSYLPKECDYYACLQADEIFHESSFPHIRAAIETGHEGFYVSRINLWSDSQHYLNVDQSRMPVGNFIIRLAKTQYKSHDDGENILVNANRDFGADIRIYHLGFVRDNKKQVIKMKNMMENIFGWGLDSRQVGKDTFSPWDYFTPADVVPIREPLPKFVQEWARERDERNKQG